MHLHALAAAASGSPCHAQRPSRAGLDRVAGREEHVGRVISAQAVPKRPVPGYRPPRKARALCPLRTGFAPELPLRALVSPEGTRSAVGEHRKRSCTASRGRNVDLRGSHGQRLHLAAQLGHRSPLGALTLDGVHEDLDRIALVRGRIESKVCTAHHDVAFCATPGRSVEVRFHLSPIAETPCENSRTILGDALDSRRVVLPREGGRAHIGHTHRKPHGAHARAGQDSQSGGEVLGLGSARVTREDAGEDPPFVTDLAAADWNA